MKIANLRSLIEDASMNAIEELKTAHESDHKNAALACVNLVSKIAKDFRLYLSGLRSLDPHFADAAADCRQFEAVCSDVRYSLRRIEQ